MATPPSLPLDIPSHRGTDESATPAGASTKTGQTPPYWTRDCRTVSSGSCLSLQHGPNAPLIVLEDNTDGQQESSDGLWARGVCIDDYVVVTGDRVGAGSYVVWICKVAMLDVSL